MALTPLFGSVEDKKKLMHDKAIEGVKSLFPIVSKKYQLDLTDAAVEPKEYNYSEQKQALMDGRSLLEPLTGTLTLKDRNGKVLDVKKNTRILNVPYTMPHNSYIIDGNTYSIANQLRTKPGIYTRVRRNEVPEVAFNLAKGANFKFTMEPETSKLKMEVLGSTVPLYPILKSLGMNDTAIRSRWGSQVLEANSDISKQASENAIDKVYRKLVPRREQSPGHDVNEKSKLIKKYFRGTKVDPETTMATLGRGYNSVSGPAMLDASEKLLKVFQAKEEHDDRDSLEFQTVHSPEDFIKERLQKSGPEIARKLAFKMDAKQDVNKVPDAFPNSAFNKPVKSLVTQFSLSKPLDQINPIEIMDNAMKVTRLGEGGIGTTRAVPEDTRDLHPSHLGIIDPVRTPESSSLGVDVRLAMASAKDDQGNLYTKVRDLKSGKTRFVSAKDIKKHTIAFPGQKLEGTVDAIKNGRVERVPVGEVNYAIDSVRDMFGPSAGLIPFVDNMQGNRALMGAKQIVQALPLKHREAPLVQAAAPKDSGFNTMQELMGRELVHTAPEDGTIERIDDDYIYLQGKSGRTHKINYARDHPYNSKTYLDERPIVQAKMEVKKGAPLTESNFTKDGETALGINARVGYMAYNGENTNDAVVVSERAANKFTSEHMYKKQLDRDKNTTIGKSFWLTQFPNKYKSDILSKLDKDGLPAPGTRINYGDPVFLATTKKPLSETDKLLGKLHTAHRKRYKDSSVTWDHEHPGIVESVHRKGNKITVAVKADAPLVVGDKLSNTYGGKGVVSRIIPDDQMPKNEAGEPLDILLAPTGVVSRINPSQIMETALSKVADKTGRKIVIDNFAPTNRLEETKKILKENNISEKETITDPVTGKKIKGVTTGKQYFYKLFKSTDTNFGARGLGAYDINEQPVRGGAEGSKRIGGMELNALLAHGATGLVKDITQLKSQRNEEWWNAYKLGLPLPPTRRVFVNDKFNSMLAGSGIKVNNDGAHVQLASLTDKDVDTMSSGAITQASVLRKKDLKPEVNGLFDPTKTGGLDGEKWSHIELSEPIVKPAFRKPAASLLGMSETALQRLGENEGGFSIEGKLRDINLDDLENKTKENIKTARGDQLDREVKRLKFIQGLKKQGLSPSEAYMGKKLPVLPPKMRPVVPGNNNQLLVADANHLYRDVILADQQLSSLKKAGFYEKDDLAPMRKELNQSVAAVAGLAEPTSYKLRQQGKKGYMKQITGSSPSQGFFQRKIYGRPQDLSGRGTIAPDPTLRMDEIGLPEETAKGMYAPFVTKRLNRMGYKATEAAEHVKDWSPVAKRALEAEVQERPVVFNRAPSLWRYSVLGAYPKIIPGKTIRTNPFIETSLAADYDGDAIQLHVPVTQKAVDDVKSITMDKLLFSDKTRGDLLAKPEMEAVAGLYEATRLQSSGKKFKFKNKDEAMQAYYAGKLNVNDEVEIGP